MNKLIKTGLASASVIALAVTALVTSPSAYAAGSSSINPQPVTKLTKGGTLTLPILYPPIQYNVSHPDGNDADVNGMMGMTQPSLIYFDSN
jgi:hypothetical protein